MTKWLTRAAIAVDGRASTVRNITLEEKMTITQDMAIARLHYDPETGIFRWKVAKGGSSAGEIAGYITSHGYIEICAYYKRTYAHRWAWLIMTGEWPVNLIDHRNNIGRDNRWENLRPANKSQNAANGKPRRSNVLKGAFPDKGEWMSRIKKYGKYHYLGRFGSELEAHQAYAAAAPIIHGEFARTL